jgi:hypothetical protein
LSRGIFQIWESFFGWAQSARPFCATPRKRRNHKLWCALARPPPLLAVQCPQESNLFCKGQQFALSISSISAAGSPRHFCGACSQVKQLGCRLRIRTWSISAAGAAFWGGETLPRCEKADVLRESGSSPGDELARQMSLLLRRISQRIQLPQHRLLIGA